MSQFKLFFETIFTMLEDKTGRDRESLLKQAITLVITSILVIIFSVNFFYEKKPTNEEIEKYSAMGDVLWEQGIQEMPLKEAEISSKTECNLNNIYTYPLNSDECKDINFKITLGDSTVISRTGDRLIFNIPNDQKKALVFDYSTADKNITLQSNFEFAEIFCGTLLFIFIGALGYYIIYFLVWLIFEIIEMIINFFNDYKEAKNEIINQEETSEEEISEEETYEGENNEEGKQTIGQVFENSQEIVKKIDQDDYNS